MTCVDIGALRAYLDRELPAGEAESIRAHLAGCAQCGNELAELERTATSVRAWLAIDATALPASSLALARARQRLAGARRACSPVAWATRWLAAAGPRWAAAGVAALMVALLALSPLSSAAQDFLSIFRVQKFAAVTIDPSQLPRLPVAEKAFEHRAVQAQMPAPPEVRAATAAEAAQAVDFPLRWAQYLPADLAGEGRTLVSSAAEFSYTVDLAEVEGYLAQAGNEQIQLPPSLDGATIRVRVPASVLTAYGAPSPAGAAGAQPAPNAWLYVAQSRGPTIEVPDSVDVESLRTQILALPILPPDVARQLQAIKDWRHTMVIPVRPGTQKDVTVAGVPGLLIEHNARERTLLWQKDGVLYGLNGTLSESDLLRVANSMR